MRIGLTIIAFVGFLSISLFGLLSINHQGGHMAECLASRLNGSAAPCPQSDPIGFANFHSNALKAISNLIVIDGAAVFYTIAAYLLLMFGIFSFLDFNILSLNRTGSFEFKLLTRNSSLQATKLYWFSLHENSPSFFRG